MPWCYAPISREDQLPRIFKPLPDLDACCVRLSSQHGRSGQHPDGELLGRRLAAAVVDPDGEGEGSRRGGGARDPTGGCLHGQAWREGAGGVPPYTWSHVAAREQPDLV